MSVANEPEMVGLHDPTQYPPRRARESSERPDDEQAFRDETPETTRRRTAQPAPRHSRSETAAPQSLRRPPGSRAARETGALARRGTLFGSAGRLAAAIGFSAAIALLFVTMMPAARQADDRQSFSAAVEPFTAALSQQHQGEDGPKDGPKDVPKAALAQFQPLLAGGDGAQAPEGAQTDMRPSDQVLQRFLQ